MKQLTFKGQHFVLNEYESVLDCLLRHGQHIPYACRAGMCQACLVKAEGGTVTEESKRWIKPALQARGYTLACQWVPPDDAACALPDVSDFSVAAAISALERPCASVLRVQLETLEPGTLFATRPGQYLSLINPDGVTRAYSIANDPEKDGYVELHIAATAHGVLSRWLFESARTGTRVHLRGPAGDCYYRAPEMAGQPLLLAGTGLTYRTTDERTISISFTAAGLRSSCTWTMTCVHLPTSMTTSTTMAAFWRATHRQEVATRAMSRTRLPVPWQDRP